MDARQVELEDRHRREFGECARCKRQPRQPFEDLCEDCAGYLATVYHGRPQTVRLDRRPREE